MKILRNYRVSFLTILSVFLLFININCGPNTKQYPTFTLQMEPFAVVNDTIKSHILYQPSIVRIDLKGNIFLLDQGNNRVVEYSSNGKYLKQIGSIGQGPGDLLNPNYIDIDGNDNLFVLEVGNKRISVFDSSGIFINSFLTPGGPDPVSICVISNKKVLVNQPEINGPLFYVYNSDGKLIDSLGRVESFENPPFKGPNFVATYVYNSVDARFDGKGRIYVSYRDRPLLKCYSESGKLIYDKNLTGSEIDSLQIRLGQIKEKNNSNTNPYLIKSIIFLRDLATYKNRILINLSGSYKIDGKEGQYFYLLNRKGNLISKYDLVPSNNLKSMSPFIWSFDINSHFQIIGCDTYNCNLIKASIPQLINNKQ